VEGGPANVPKNEYRKKVLVRKTYGSVFEGGADNGKKRKGSYSYEGGKRGLPKGF